MSSDVLFMNVICYVFFMAFIGGFISFIRAVVNLILWVVT